MIDGGWQQTVIGMSTDLPVTGLPIAVFNAAVLYAAVFMMVLTILDVLSVLAGGPVPVDAEQDDPLA